MTHKQPIRRKASDVSPKVAVPGILGQILVVIEGIADGSYDWKAALVLAGLAFIGYVKKDKIG